MIIMNYTAIKYIDVSSFLNVIMFGDRKSVV